MADGGGSDGVTETTLPNMFALLGKAKQKTFDWRSIKKQGGFTGNMVVIWRKATTANSSGVSRRLPIVSLILSLSVRGKAG